jgi:two-component system CheB/CheR fusion protein
LINYRQDGTPYDAELFITPLFDAAGKRTNFIAIHRDVSDRIELQREVLEIATKEQRRIGQDLHDGVGQELTGLGMVAEGLAQILTGERFLSSPESSELLHVRQLAKQVSEGIGRTTAHVRELSHGLVPVDVDPQGLMAGLRELVDSTNALHDISCTFESDRPVHVRDNFTATHLYRIAQEAIGNALRHGGAGHIRVCLHDEDERVVLSVTDDGIGMENATSSSGGMGLRIMHYRAGLIGATLDFEAASGSGTTVRCAVPQGGGNLFRLPT